MKHKNQIINLHNEGKTKQEIQKILGCAQSTVTYHLSQGQKEKAIKRALKRNSTLHPYVKKLSNFLVIDDIKPAKEIISKMHRQLYDKLLTFHKDRKTKQMSEIKFTIQDVIKKFGEHPKCYLTGKIIDIYKPSTYHFDHIIPKSKGGSNTIDNLGICTKEANLAKSELTPDEFYELCKQVCKTYESK